MLFRDVQYLADSDQIKTLGFYWDKSVKRLQQRQEHAAQVAHDNNQDLSKLHRSDKCKSGFVGVYSNGNGYRAEGKNPHDPKSTITVGSFKTAEEAALARLHHHQKYKLPYGKLEEEMVKIRHNEEWLRDLPDERVKHEVIYMWAHEFREPLPNLSDEDRELENIDPHTGKAPWKGGEMRKVVDMRTQAQKDAEADLAVREGKK
jgi:hypothetical protein